LAAFNGWIDFRRHEAGSANSLSKGAARLNVGSFQEWILLEQPFLRVACCQLCEHILDGDSHPADDRLTAKDGWICGSSAKEFLFGHWINSQALSLSYRH
jgi:hypothetical protein